MSIQFPLLVTMASGNSFRDLAISKVEVQLATAEAQNLDSASITGKLYICLVTGVFAAKLACQRVQQTQWRSPSHRRPHLS